MICFHMNHVLLFTSNEQQTDCKPDDEQTLWIQVEAGDVGGTLRLIHHHAPEIVAFDLSQQHPGADDFARTLQMIRAVRSRAPRVKIVAIGSTAQPAMEAIVRQQGVTAYTPLSPEQHPHDARELIQALYSRHGPNRVHAPPDHHARSRV